MQFTAILKNALLPLVLIALMPAFSYSTEGGLQKVDVLVRKEIARRSPSLKDAKIEVLFRDAKGLSSYGGYELKLSYPENMSLSGDVILPVEVYSGPELKGKVNVRASIRVFRNVVFASSRIRKGDVFTPKNTGYVEKDITRLADNYLTDAKRALGKQASTFIPKGALILDWMPKEVPAVKKGDMVELFKRVNGVFVKVKAVAIEDGYINGNIRVRNTGSNKTVEGKVKSSGEVEAL